MPTYVYVIVCSFFFLFLAFMLYCIYEAAQEDIKIKKEKLKSEYLTLEILVLHIDTPMVDYEFKLLTTVYNKVVKDFDMCQYQSLRDGMKDLTKKIHLIKRVQEVD